MSVLIQTQRTEACHLANLRHSKCLPVSRLIPGTYFHDPNSSSRPTQPLWKHKKADENGTSVRCLVRYYWSCSLTPYLVAYYTQETLEYLRVVDDIPMLHSLHVPPGRYKSARSAKGRGARDPHITGYSPGGAHGGPYAAFPTPPISHPHPPNSSRLGILAPLAYLQNLPPPRRHPFDEELLMSLAMTI